MRYLKIIVSLVFIFFILKGDVYSCGPEIKREPIEVITIFCPENFAPLIKELRSIFEKKYPRHTIYAPEASDLENIYDILHFKKIPDVLILSDDSLIDKFLSSYIDWYIVFACDKIVLAFKENSKYSAVINEKNWYKIISQKDVRLGRMSEKNSSLGYRTLMVLDLACKFYPQFNNLNFLPQNIFSTEKELNFLLLAGDLDYIFDYLSSAKKYKFRYITLPAQIDLSSCKFKENYAQAKLNLGGRILKGAPIHYIITIPNSVMYPERGLKFLKIMFSKEGKEMLKKYKIQIIKPYLEVINKTSILKDIEEILKGVENE